MLTVRVSRALHPTQQITAHFGDEDFQVNTCTQCTGSDNNPKNKRKYTKNIKQKIHQKHKTNKLALGKKNAQKHTKYPKLN